MDKPKTKEAIEYEKCLKTLHELSLKKALSEDGIDTSKVPRKKLDDIRRLVDRQQPVHHKYREIINKAQQESNAIITKANQDMQAELTAAVVQRIDIVAINNLSHQSLLLFHNKKSGENRHHQ